MSNFMYFLFPLHLVFLVLLPSETATLSQPGSASSGLAEDGGAAGADNNGLGVAENRGDPVTVSVLLKAFYYYHLPCPRREMVVYFAWFTPLVTAAMGCRTERNMQSPAASPQPGPGRGRRDDLRHCGGKWTIWDMASVPRTGPRPCHYVGLCMLNLPVNLY